MFGLPRKAPQLALAIPNENWEILLRFANGECRLFPAAQARTDKGYAFLAYPDRLKAFTCDAQGLYWDEGASLDTRYLYRHSQPIAGEALTRQYLRLGYLNQAPTAEHPSHHVYDVLIHPFAVQQPFSLGESIGGGHAEMGGYSVYSHAELLAAADWQQHFTLAGCAWAIPLVAQPGEIAELLQRLAASVCSRNRAHNPTEEEPRGTRLD